MDYNGKFLILFRVLCSFLNWSINMYSVDIIKKVLSSIASSKFVMFEFVLCPALHVSRPCIRLECNPYYEKIEWDSMVVLPRFINMY